MRIEKTKKKEPLLYLLSYRRGGLGDWIETIPMYERRVVRRNESYYSNVHGSSNVRVDVIDKMGRRRRPDTEYGDGDEE